MADNDKALLESLTNTSLPALPSTPEPEPTEPSKEVSTEGERGREPDDVVVSRETRLPATEEEKAQPPAKPEEKRYEVRGIKYTAKELEAAGLLEDLAITHSKYEHLQKKHLQEKEKAEVAKPKEPAVPVITNSMIAKAYDAAATAIMNDLVQSNLMEGDLGEAYPRAMTTLIGQLRYFADLIFSNQEKLDAIIAEVSSAKEKVQSQVTANTYNQHLDALVQKDAKLYAGLKDPKIRTAFTKFLVDDVGATIGQATGDKAPTFLAKQWVAFNADTVIEAAKNGAAEKTKSANRRFVVGEGTGSRTAGAETEQTHLERMISNSGKIPE